MLANAALLPAVHFAREVGAGPTSLVHASGHQGHHNPGPTDEGENPAKSEHQVCHFCRLLGVSLPPPALVTATIAFFTVRWSVPLQPIQRQKALRAANLPRAPPARG
jgi:hypothetical protein